MSQEKEKKKLTEDVGTYSKKLWLNNCTRILFLHELSLGKAASEMNSMTGKILTLYSMNTNKQTPSLAVGTK